MVLAHFWIWCIGNIPIKQLLLITKKPCVYVWLYFLFKSRYCDTVWEYKKRNKKTGFVHSLGSLKIPAFECHWKHNPEMCFEVSCASPGLLQTRHKARLLFSSWEDGTWMLGKGRSA